MGFLERDILTLKGVGKSRAEQLNKLGIYTIRDLVYYFPRAYEMRGDIRLISASPLNENVSLLLTVGTSVRSTRIPGKLTISKFKAFDDSGAVEVVFFNSKYVQDVFTVGSVFRFYGKLSFSKKTLQLNSPKYEPYFESKPLPDLIPVYPLTNGLSSKIIDKLILSVIDEAVSCTTDPLPEDIRLRLSLPTLSKAIKDAHFPLNEQTLSHAMSRLAFDEMLTFGLGIALQSKIRTECEGITFSPCSMKPITDLLPYELTQDQKNAVNDIYRDTVMNGSSRVPMARIIVGDVGSGKTVCALMAIYIAVKSGYQAALMAPTEILARQHYKEFKETFGKLGFNTELLIGSTTQKEKTRIYAGLEDGSVNIVIGTHALLSEKTVFKSLGLVVTDEQHRFGVTQRAALITKGKCAHMLVMSATPIPRTLALTMYGDLDVSRIKQMPSGRIPVDTFVVDEGYRARLNDFISKQVALGGQCYVVCPAIENKSDVDEECFEPNSLSSLFSAPDLPQMKNATEHTEKLRAVLPNLRIECLHGKMKSKDKDEIMQRFAAGEIDVLVSTTVIEIGINVPNASLMIIENAERFGLAQLHQLRGRVGRGSRKSYCVLVSDLKSEKSVERLSVMKHTRDGYEIAERDLILRGPGDFFSNNSDDILRQSGGFEFKFAKLCDDNKLLEVAFATAKSIAEDDPKLEKSEHLLLRESVKNILQQNISNIS